VLQRPEHRVDVEMRGQQVGHQIELRVAARVVTAAILEASKEWMQSNGRLGLADLANRALAVVESGARLRAPARAKPRQYAGQPRLPHPGMSVPDETQACTGLMLSSSK